MGGASALPFGLAHPRGSPAAAAAAAAANGRPEQNNDFVDRSVAPVNKISVLLTRPVGAGRAPSLAARSGS